MAPTTPSRGAARDESLGDRLRRAANSEPRRSPSSRGGAGSPGSTLQRLARVLGRNPPPRSEMAGPSSPIRRRTFLSRLAAAAMPTRATAPNNNAANNNNAVDNNNNANDDAAVALPQSAGVSHLAMVLPDIPPYRPRPLNPIPRVAAAPGGGGDGDSSSSSSSNNSDSVNNDDHDMDDAPQLPSRDPSPELNIDPVLHACVYCVSRAANLCCGQHPRWELACIRGAASRCRLCEMHHKSCEEVPALIAGNVRGALRAIARCIELCPQYVPDAGEEAPGLVLLAGEYLRQTVRLIRAHKRDFSLNTGPTGAVSRARYDGVVQEARSARLRFLLAAGDDGLEPERSFLRLMPGDRLYNQWAAERDQFLNDVESLANLEGLPAIRVHRRRQHLDPTPP